MNTVVKNKVLFFHGGPGLNSNPENKLLTQKFDEIGLQLLCWNEPSSQRSAIWPAEEKESYHYYLDRAEKYFLEQYEGTPLFVLAHSFGAHSACHLAKMHPEKIAKIFFIASDLDLATTDLNMLKFVTEDFKLHEDERALALEKIIQKYTGKFDFNTEDGFNLMVQNPRWFDYYWHNKGPKGNYEVCFLDPGFNVDMEAFFKVRRSFYSIELVQSSVPAVAIFGKNDIVVSSQHELKILKDRFSSLKVHVLEHSAHYPHIEQSEEFHSILLNEMN